jgi:methylglutaconyl-CoA hydratase
MYNVSDGERVKLPMTILGTIPHPSCNCSYSSHILQVSVCNLQINGYMQNVQIEHRGAVAFVRLDRPAQRNALSLSLIIELSEIIERLSLDDAVRVIVLSGNGRHFCAGADLEWMQAAAALDLETNRREAQILGRLFQIIDTSPKAVIGAIRGAAVGGGAGLVAVCDYVIASESAFFRFSEVRLGLIPAVISPYVLAKLGPSTTRAYFTSGEQFDAARAREIGFAHEIVADEMHTAAVDRMIASYLTCAPGAIAATKDLLRTLSHEPPGDTASRASLCAEAIAARRVTAEARQGLSAFFAHDKAPWLTSMPPASDAS